MKIWIFRLVLVIVALTIPNLSQGATYYISPAGSDSCNGLSSSSARKTFDHAIPHLQPGDTLILLDGVYTAPNGTGLPYINCESGGNAKDGTAA